jgi:hypothetical protein
VERILGFCGDAVDEYRADSKALSVMAAIALVIPERFFRFCSIFQGVGSASLYFPL